MKQEDIGDQERTHEMRKKYIYIYVFMKLCSAKKINV